MVVLLLLLRLFQRQVVLFHGFTPPSGSWSDVSPTNPSVPNKGEKYKDGQHTRASDTGTVQLSDYIYYQQDFSKPPNYNIPSSGRGPTSLAMAISDLTRNPAVLPTQIADEGLKAPEGSRYSTSSGSEFGLYSYMAGLYGLQCKKLVAGEDGVTSDRNAIIEEVYKALQSGAQVISCHVSRNIH